MKPSSFDEVGEVFAEHMARSSRPKVLHDFRALSSFREKNASGFQLLEEKMQVTPVLLGVEAGHENVVDVHKEEIFEFPTDLVHKSLRCLCCVLEAEGHAEELE